MNRVTTEIERLGFEHSCVGLARQLGRRAGIQRVDVDERTNRATITYDDTRLTARHVRHLIAQCGYEVRDTPLQDDASGVEGIAPVVPDEYGEAMPRISVIDGKRPSTLSGVLV